MTSHSVSRLPSRLVADSPASLSCHHPKLQDIDMLGFSGATSETSTTRSQILGLPGTLLQQGTYIQTDSPSNSSSRGRWNRLQRWDDFSDLVETFWVNLSDEEKSTVIFAFPFQFVTNYRTTSIGNLPRPTNESMIYSHIDLEYVNTHNDVSTQLPLSCHHAKIIRADQGYSAMGIPDYMFVDEGSGTLLGIMEVKTFWKVSFESIEEVITGNPCTILR